MLIDIGLYYNQIFQKMATLGSYRPPARDAWALSCRLTGEFKVVECWWPHPRTATLWSFSLSCHIFPLAWAGNWAHEKLMGGPKSWDLSWAYIPWIQVFYDAPVPVTYFTDTWYNPVNGIVACEGDDSKTSLLYRWVRWGTEMVSCFLKVTWSGWLAGLVIPENWCCYHHWLLSYIDPSGLVLVLAFFECLGQRWCFLRLLRATERGCLCRHLEGIRNDGR